MDGDTYDHSLQLHYRQFLVALLFVDLPSLSSSFHEMIFTLVYIQCTRKGRCVSLQKARRKRRHDYPDAKVETERSVPYSLRRRRKIVAALKLPRPESVQTEIEERGVSIQKARRKRTHDIDNLAIIHVSSCNDVLALQEMSLATFRIELGLHSMCMSRLHALYFMLRTSYSMCMYLR